ncbi:hypothetical protein IIA79_06815, partial [bacterium]|nr:hypothetical protein [bacterium]
MRRISTQISRAFFALRLAALVSITLALCACDLLSSSEDGPAKKIEGQLNQLQIVLEKSVGDEGITRIAIVAIVDSGALGTGGGGGEEEMRRERVVRQELGNRLVNNRLIEVVQPTPEQIDRAVAEISSKNSAALSPPLSAEIGGELSVEHLLSAIVDDGGSR